MDSRGLKNLSKKIVNALRHDIKVPRNLDGFVSIEYILLRFHVSKDTIQRMIDSFTKVRLEVSECGSFIRSICGHSTIDVNTQCLGVPLLNPSGVTCIHGTSLEAASSIATTGLNAGKRRYIHFASSLDSDYLRDNSEVLLYLDVGKYLKCGNKLFTLANGVVITTGNNEGRVKPSFLHPVIVSSE